MDVRLLQGLHHKPVLQRLVVQDGEALLGCLCHRLKVGVFPLESAQHDVLEGVIECYGIAFGAKHG
ncbi:hypothetical protein D3C86_1783060 [compost metagenome]